MKAPMTAKVVKNLASEALARFASAKDTGLASHRMAAQRIHDLASAVTPTTKVELDQADWSVLNYGRKADAAPQTGKTK
jgi:hypothetical protein